MRRWAIVLPILLSCHAASAQEEEKPEGAGLFDVLMKARENAKRTACASNLSQLGKAMMIFASVPANKNKFPDRLEDLFGDRFAKDRKLFLCPSVKEGKHRKVEGDVGCCDYLYIPGCSDEDGTCIVAFCPKANHGGKGWNVLYGAGTVEWIEDPAAFKKALLDTLKEKEISLDLPQEAPPKIAPDQEKKLRKALADLASDAFDTRSAAQKVLQEAGEAARPFLDEGAKAKDAETQQACRQLIARLDQQKPKRALIEALRRELDMDKEAKGEKQD